MVSARGEESDRVVGLELGADDYIVKPFGLRELIARIRAVTRRTEPRAQGPSVLHVAGLAIDERARRVQLDERELALTPKEFDLLATLARDAGAAVSRQRLLEEVWNTTWFGSTKTIDVHVASLRRKLGDPGWIETVRGVGFRLRTCPAVWSQVISGSRCSSCSPSSCRSASRTSETNATTSRSRLSATQQCSRPMPKTPSRPRTEPSSPPSHATPTATRRRPGHGS